MTEANRVSKCQCGHEENEHHFSEVNHGVCKNLYCGCSEYSPCEAVESPPSYRLLPQSKLKELG